VRSVRGEVDVKLGPREVAVLHALVESGGRVVDRDRLRRDAGLQDLNDRSCDSALVGIRRVLGPDAVVTVRRRGWRLDPEAVALAVTILASLG
jgi:DNA-binding winged helix-turn-helix (wHTH) protein